MLLQCCVMEKEDLHVDDRALNSLLHHVPYQ